MAIVVMTDDMADQSIEVGIKKIVRHVIVISKG